MHFGAWLDASGFDEHSLRHLDPSLFHDILGTYLDHIQAGNNLVHAANLALETQRLYISAASGVISLYTDIGCSTIDAATMLEKRPTTIPYLALRFAQATAWREPLPRKECFTMDMYLALRALLDEMSASQGALPTFLNITYLVYDIQRLNLFTGSRLTEYGQSKTKKGERFATIPNNSSAGPWAQMPLAFIQADFTFLDNNMNVLTELICLTKNGAVLAFELHLRFRFDK